jgi:hypothetical protein
VGRDGHRVRRSQPIRPLGTLCDLSGVGVSDLAVWMKPEDGWVRIDDNSDMYAAVCDAAGCDGRVFANGKTGDVVLCDGADLVLFRTTWNEMS